MQPAVPSGVPLVVVFSPVLLLLRQSSPQPRPCRQAVDGTTPRVAGRPSAAVSHSQVRAFAGAAPLAAGQRHHPLFRTAGSSAPAVSVLMPDVTAPRAGSVTPVLTTGRKLDRRRVAEAYRQPFGREYTRVTAAGWMATGVRRGGEGLLSDSTSHHADAAALGGARGDDCLRDADRPDGPRARHQRAAGFNISSRVSQSFRCGIPWSSWNSSPSRRFASDLWITKNRNWRK